MSIHSNTPENFEDPALIDETVNDFTDDEYLLSELPFIHELNTEPKELENE